MLADTDTNFTTYDHAQVELDRLNEIIERVHQQASRVKDSEIYPSIKQITEVDLLLGLIGELEG